MRCIKSGNFIGQQGYLMSNKLDFMNYAKSMLVTASSKLKSETPANNDTAGRLDQIARTAENISDGYWAPRFALDFRRLACPVKYRHLFDVVGCGGGWRIFGSVPQRFGLGIQAVGRFICLAS
jgi:hypothetical protein